MKNRWEQSGHYFSTLRIEKHQKPNGILRLRLVDPTTRLVHWAMHFGADGKNHGVTFSRIASGLGSRQRPIR